MRVLIVAKTRRGTGACVGGITTEGHSVRLIAADAARNEHAGLEYEVGEVWELEAGPDPDIIPPHVENVIVHGAQRMKCTDNMEAIIRRFMPPVIGGPEKLFDGRLQHLGSGALYIAERTGLPSRSTLFWVPDQPLRRDCEGKRIRYRYPTADGGLLLTFVGFQDPPEEIPAGTLLRVSLAHWWRPKDQPAEELRCHAQLSGWFLTHAAADAGLLHPPAGAGMRSDQTDARFSHPAQPNLARARQVLKQVFGYSDFQSLQADIVVRMLQRRDTLVIMPTGGGKSLCYQLPALLFDGLTVVVSPLIALMQDQVTQLQQAAVPAAFLNHTLTNAEYVAITRHIRRGNVRILYVAPETLLRPEVLVLLEQSRLACLAVDEAHCISEWGHDFRPEYRHIRQVRQRFPQTVCIALTATATQRVREDIEHSLGIPHDGTFIASFNRPNLFLTVQPRRDDLRQTLDFLERHRGQAGIIYCSTRMQVDSLTTELRTRGWPALSYHAGLEAETRRRNQDAFIHDDATIMVATVAFGMGINKSNVRFVLHYNLPKDIESYYQEIGRAGRDGLPAHCLLLHSRADTITIRKFINDGAASERDGRAARLDALLRYTETADCRRAPLLAYFGETHEARCGHCDNCQGSQSADGLTDVTEAARKFLACVECTGECFSTAHIIKVLRGSRARSVASRRHDRLTVHGGGREFTVAAWRELGRQFIEQNLVEQDLRFGGLRLTPKGQRARTEGRIMARLITAAPPASYRGSEAARHDAALFERLRALRRELASQAGVPTYVVFSDRALIEMAARLPRTPEQFLTVSGVGEAKLTRYGEAFLKVIHDYCAAHSLTPLTAATPESEPTRWPTTQQRYKKIGEAFAGGQSLDELAGSFGIKPETVLRHLTHFAKSGGRLDGDRLVCYSRLSKPERDRTIRAFVQLGMERLGPVHEVLGGSVPYEELHLLRLWLKCQQTAS